MSKLEEAKDAIRDAVENEAINGWYALDEVIREHKEQTIEACFDRAMDAIQEILGAEFDEEDADALLADDYGSLMEMIDDYIYSEWDV